MADALVDPCRVECLVGGVWMDYVALRRLGYGAPDLCISFPPHYLVSIEPHKYSRIK